MVHINAPLFSRTATSEGSGHQVVPTDGRAPLQPLRDQRLHQSTTAGSGLQKLPAPSPIPTKPGMKLVAAWSSWIGSYRCMVCLCVCAVVAEGAMLLLGSLDSGPGLRRRANLGANPFMQQRTSLPESAGGMQQQQYRPREDAQTRYNNAAQVESTIVEVRCFCKEFRIPHDTIMNQLPRDWCLLYGVDYRHVHPNGHHGR